MIQFKVIDECQHFVSAEDGHGLYVLIRDDVEAGETVCVDFAGVKIVTATFLGAAFGAFYKKLTSDELNARVKITNLPPMVQPMFKEVMRDMCNNFAYERNVYQRSQQDS